MIGQIVAPFGVRGELKVHIESDDPERFALLKKVFLGDALVRYNVISSRLHQGAALLRLEGVTDRNAAEALRGTYVYVEMRMPCPWKRANTITIRSWALP